MAVIKCKVCGGSIDLLSDKTIGVCDYCGSMITFPKIDDEQRAAAFNRGNHFRRMGEFDKALGVYEHIIQEDDTDAEAHWCCALSRFGIEYVEDPSTYEWLPTCHRLSFDSFLEDVDYKAALENSDGVTRRQYQKDAAKIAEVQRGILATSQNTEPYDVFICYKETDESGQRTKDSLLAQDIYYQLTEQGRRVFFSRITLEEVPGTEYEPYIFAALNSAKVMVVVGTKAEYLNAVWVKNEWSRFLSMMRKDRSKLLIPCYRDMDPYDLPEQLAVLQSYDMGKIGFIQDLIRGVNKVLDVEKKSDIKESVIIQRGSTGSVDALLKRGYLALEDGEWEAADGFFEEVLNQDAECAKAYLGKLLASSRIKTVERLDECDSPLKDNPLFIKAVRFSKEDDKNQLVAIGEKVQIKIRERNEIALAETHRRINTMFKKAAQVISTSMHSVGITDEDCVVAVGNNTYGQCEVDDWYDVISVVAGCFHTVGLKNDHTVIAVGDNDEGQCEVDDWQDVVAIAAGKHTVGLRSDGTVLVTGDNSNGQCEVGDWNNIISISASWFHTVGLKADGTVVAVGDNSAGQCDVSEWRDIISIAAGGSHTIGLKSDGTVVAVGCYDDNEPYYGQCDVEQWNNIVSIAAGLYCSVGLRNDGTVVAAGDISDELETWRDIVAVAAGNTCVLGLHSDGTVIGVGDNENGECDFPWSLKSFHVHEYLGESAARRKRLS